jgi:putative ABC transport system permease protein
LSQELFDDESPLGERVRIGGSTFLVIGVMEAKGQMLGFDFDDIAFISVASAMDLFNVDELVEIDIVAAGTDVIPEVVEGIRSMLMRRHRGEEDFTITTQTEMLDTFGKQDHRHDHDRGVRNRRCLVAGRRDGHPHHHVDLGPRTDQ